MLEAFVRLRADALRAGCILRDTLGALISVSVGASVGGVGVSVWRAISNTTCDNLRRLPAGMASSLPFELALRLFVTFSSYTFQNGDGVLDEEDTSEWNVEEVEPESAVRRLAEILSLSQIVELLEVVALREAPAAGGDREGAGLRLRTGGLLVLKKS